MIKITQEELKKIIDLTKTVPEEYRQKCFELLLSNALKSLSPPEPDVTPETIKDTKKLKTAPQFVLPIDVKAFLSQYGLDESLIWKLFIVEGTDIRPIYKLSVHKKATAQIQHTLMMALETAITTGQFQVDVESIRTRCEEQKCYDAPNFMKIIRNNESLFKSIEKDQPLTLSPEGKAELADVLEQFKK